MNDENKLKFLDFGALKYSRERMISILGIKDCDFDRLWEDAEEVYNKGAFDFTFAVDRKLMQLASSGDIKAMAKIESNTEIREKEDREKAKKLRGSIK